MTPRVETHIRLGISSVSPSDQSPCCPHEETFGPYLPIAKFLASFSAKYRRVSPQTFAEKTLGEIMDFYFFSAKKFISRKECTATKREKRAFSFG